ncbi:MAG TPA: hypothetical protein VD997_02730 [Phycisphaerales bacterium]|nr:hypothetical protein [Phycisphaerales bacterium]
MTSRTMQPPTNTPELVRKHLEASKKFLEETLRTPGAARAHLIKLGIVDEKGRLTKEYSDK